jgi:aminopeptidase
MDEGARRLGEAAFGTNYNIQRFTRNTLFDEKIGGTIHLALGSSFDEIGGLNKSALHWDIVNDMRQGGEAYADGQLFYKDGKFLM